MELLLYLIAGLLGIAGHWYIRWSQDRTDLSFVEYLKTNSRKTVASAISILGSSLLVYQVSPPELSTQLLITSFLAGYTLDSSVNKDPTNIAAGGGKSEKKKRLSKAIASAQSD